MKTILWAAATLAAIPACAAPEAPALSAADQAGAFKAAGFKKVGGQWQGCGDPGTASYSPGTLEQVLDLNGDGMPEAVLMESSVYCFGDAGMGYSIVSKQASGGWKRVTANAGIPTFLATKGAGGWPDISVGGPGLCFPVQRWNGQHYQTHRYEYQGKPCQAKR